MRTCEQPGEGCGEQRFTNKSRYGNLINLSKPLYLLAGIPRSDLSNLLVETRTIMSRDSAAHADWCINEQELGHI